VNGYERTRFELAPMSPAIRALTVGLLALPLVLLWLARGTGTALTIPALLMAAVYAWVWLRFRPTAFVVRPGALEVIWPLKRGRLSLATVSSVQLIDRHEVRRRIGFAIRIGAGGLWGGFGWLWTTRRGMVRMYVSRLDQFVWIERRGGPPWLITPDSPDMFVRALTAAADTSPERVAHFGAEG
jgi:hypothetical protein